jgi:hypothetical protein
MAMTPQIESALHWFEQIYLKGIPVLLRQNETAFLSFVCTVAAIDALAGYRYTDQDVGKRFREFISIYFPTAYAAHAVNLYLFRCRLLHNFSPAYFSLAHAASSSHLQKSPIGDTILSDDVFFDDMKAAAEKYFGEIRVNSKMQDDMNARLKNLKKGGAIGVG